MRLDLDSLRPIDLHSDIGAVTDLIVLSFGHGLDAVGQMALEQMRRRSRRRVWTRWLSWPEHVRPGVLRSGFVWEEAGSLVGNVSLRPARHRGGFIIGNVCVHPDWRRRGIATALMKESLREIRRHAGRWIGLEVDADNVAGRAMYEGMGFCEAGRTLRLLRPSGSSGRVAPERVPGVSWRSAGRTDSQTLYRLAQTTIPRPLHTLLELRSDQYVAGWDRAIDKYLSGEREFWWIAEDESGPCGAVRAVRRRPSAPDRVEVLAGAAEGKRLGKGLAARGLLSLRRPVTKVVEIVLASPLKWLAVDLETLGFRRSRELLQMKLDVRSASPPC